MIFNGEKTLTYWGVMFFFPRKQTFGTPKWRWMEDEFPFQLGEF